METRLDLYQRVTPLAGLGIFEWNFKTGEMYWNRVVRQIYDVQSDYEPSLEDSIKFYNCPDRVRKIIETAIASRKPETETLELVSASGVSKWVKVNLQADSEDGECTRIYGTIVDITEYQRMIRLLEEREKLFTTAFDHAPIGMALVALTGEWMKVNSSLSAMLGYREEEFLKHTFQDFTHPDDLDKDLESLNLLLAGRIRTYNLEKRYFHADGHIIWAALYVSLVRNETGKPMYFVSQIKDITERKRDTEIIHNQNSRLLNFAHIVSHNLRSHTGNLKMLSDMILQENDIDERDGLVAMLNESSENLLVTLEHLNEVVKINESSQTDRTTLNLKDAVVRVLNILSASILQLDASIHIDIPDDICVEFNSAYLESVIMNLLTNSLKYKHPDRQPNVEIVAGRNNQQTFLSIKDNGLGIDLALHGHKLFGMYKTFHRHPEARGMGLFLVKNQVDTMGATIHAESEAGVGSTFIVQFQQGNK